MSYSIVIKKITKATNKKNIYYRCIIDLSKAFNTHNHQILPSKLRQYEIRGVALEWFNSYVCNRYQ